MKFSRRNFSNEMLSRRPHHGGGHRGGGQRGDNPIINELSSFLDKHFSELRDRIGKLEQDRNNNFRRSEMPMNRRY